MSSEGTTETALPTAERKPMTEVTFNENVHILRDVAAKHGLKLEEIGHEGEEFTHEVQGKLITTKVSAGHTRVSVSLPEKGDLTDFWKEVEADKGFKRD